MNKTHSPIEKIKVRHEKFKLICFNDFFLVKGNVINKKLPINGNTCIIKIEKWLNFYNVQQNKQFSLSALNKDCMHA